jgi:UDP-N-acetylmuramate dehydrogenase
MNELRQDLEKLAEVEVERPLSTLTTLRIGGPAAFVVYPRAMVALDAIVRLLKQRRVPYKLLGNGSNLLASDDRYDGVIISLKKFDDVYIMGDTIMAQAGSSIVALSYLAMEEGLSGLEFASGIPGTVGGVTFMNAGAYLSDMSAVIEEVFVYRSGCFSWMKKEECGFAYRTSVFQQNPDWIILAVRMKLHRMPYEEIHDLMDSRRQRRMASQPLDMPSAGSVFRNPEGQAAWQLIDGIGYRGHRIGGAMVSPKHGNFIINAGGASASDFLTLVEEIQTRVKAQYGIDLYMEVEKFNWR